MAASASRKRGSLPVHGIVWFYILLLMFPLYFVLVSSFKDNTAIFASGFAFPSTWHLDNYTKAWEYAGLGPAMINSLIITFSAEVLGLMLAIPAAYALARSRSRLAALQERAFSLGFLIPSFAALVPTVLLAINLEMFQSQTFVICAFAAGAQPLTVILLAQFMRTIPRELDEAATMDGAGRVRMLWNLFIPLSAPGIATVFILNFLGVWNEYLFSATLLGLDESVRTVQVALPTLSTQTNPQFGVLLAGTVITSVPIFALFIVLQRQMMNALTAGSVKG